MKTNICLQWYLGEFLLEWEIFHTKVVESIKTHIYVQKFFLKNRAICEIMWRNIVEQDRPQMTIWRMRVADTHSQYVILLFHCNNGCSNTSQCYILHICLSCLFLCSCVICLKGFTTIIHLLMIKLYLSK